MASYCRERRPWCFAFARNRGTAQRPFPTEQTKLIAKYDAYVPRPESGCTRIRSNTMRTILDSNDRQFLEVLHKIGSATVQRICDEMEVTATSIRQRLSRLQVHGFVDRVAVRKGRGRPHHCYQVTDAGLKELGDNYSDLAMIVWSELQNIEDSTVRTDVLRRVKDSFIQRYGNLVHGKSLLERMEQLKLAMVERGFDVELDLSGPLPILRENNCPYHDLANADSRICELEQEVFQSVLGVDVNLSQCCLDGHHCCEFEAVSEPA
jgi:predicted ArsR family transcriptional regulator